LVTDVPPGGLADAAGFKVGDIIVEVGGSNPDVPVQGPEDLREALSRYQDGSEVEFDTYRSYFRGYDRGDVDVRLDD
jgi:S1-C subfamily serine protease